MDNLPINDFYDFTFLIPARGVPKGSTHAFKSKHSNKIITQQNGANALYAYQYLVSLGARQRGVKPLDNSVSIKIRYNFARPQSHYIGNKREKGLKASAPKYYAQTPDIDKLDRAVLDGLTGVAYVDDKQVVSLQSEKHWSAECENVHVWIKYLR